MNHLVSGASALVPPWSEVRSAVAHTRLLVKLRWRFVRSTRSRLMIWLGLAGFLLGLFIASQTGNLIRTYAEQGVGTTAGQFAVNYVIALNRGELGLIGASAVGSVIIVALFIPFTGAAMQPLASTEDLSGLRPTRIHRFFDSLVTNAASAVGFLQLITLTGIGSLLTLDGGRTGGLLFMWSIWPALLLLSVTEGWLIELAHRRYGPTVRRSIGAGLAAVIGAAVFLDPHHGKTLFGVGNQIASTLAAAAHGNVSVVARSLGVVTVVGVTLFLIGITSCRAALALPAPIPVTRSERRRLVPISTRPTVALLQVLFAQVVRTPEVRRPLRTIVLLGVPAALLGAQENVMTTLVVAIPLAVALAFGINIFGVLGSALPWLASQPGLMRKLLVTTAGLQIVLTLVLAVMVWAPAVFRGRLSLADAAAVAAGTVVSTAMTARSAAHKSVNRPFLIRLGTRGDMIVPPLTAVNYTLRFALWSGQLGVLVMIQDRWLQLLLVTFAVVWSALRFKQLFRQWADRDTQAFVIKQVAAA